MSGTYFAPHQDEGYTQIMYLNDDYEGGEFILNDLGFTLKPKKGDIVIFEGTMTHSISKILSGTRYAIITTFHKKWNKFLNLFNIVLKKFSILISHWPTDEFL